MQRRGFLGTLAAAAAALVLDPEKALWRPGEKKIFIPPAPAPPGEVIFTMPGNYRWIQIRGLAQIRTKDTEPFEVIARKIGHGIVPPIKGEKGTYLYSRVDQRVQSGMIVSYSLFGDELIAVPSNGMDVIGVAL